ncbi:ribonuclease E inhibitor RraB [Shewanella sp. YLB-07]|uniref:ribonuclease E inhibitor RraB n=1 Tax=Shewanella sp. YLB-07 TaxID=2601268 RepID=UPI00128B4E31|nr:ribonuclease E inhibitor RraB [Shewanella sp. YLB-07]MPY26196.1 ribonuclease E inhibitor RraB [Shewanella sp. YLB-07]
MHIVEKLLDSAYQDSELLKKRDEMGDVFSAFHDVDFCIEAPDKEKAETVCSFINDNRYGNAHVEEADGNFRVITITNTPVTQEIISSLSANMVSIAAIFRCEFSGWGSTIITAEDL